MAAPIPAKKMLVAASQSGTNELWRRSSPSGNREPNPQAHPGAETLLEECGAGISRLHANRHTPVQSLPIPFLTFPGSGRKRSPRVTRRTSSCAPPLQSSRAAPAQGRRRGARPPHKSVFELKTSLRIAHRSAGDLRPVVLLGPKRSCKRQSMQGAPGG